MKILHVTQGYAPAIGGTEWLMQRISEELVRQYGDQVTVFTTNCYNGEGFFSPHHKVMPIGWEELNGVKIRRFPVRSRLGWFYRKLQWLPYHLDLPGNQHLRALASGPLINGLETAIQTYPADVIAASSFPLLHMFTAQKAAQTSGRPNVLHGGLHPADRWGFNRPMIYSAIRKATAYIANTGYEARYVIQQDADPERVHTVGVGVDLEVFQDVSQAEARKRLGLGDGPLIGFIGQLGAAKGVDTLLRSMRIVWEIFPEVHVLIAGGRTLFADQLEAIISQFPEEKRTQIHMHYNFTNAEKPWLFNAVDIFAYPSGFESFGIAFLEAWASKKPVIGCRTGAIPWVVSAGRDGLLVRYKMPEPLAEAIVMLLQNSRYARALGENGYRKVVERYTWPTVARRFREIYEKTISNTGHV